jgi:hypothetical protein
MRGLIRQTHSFRTGSRERTFSSRISHEVLPVHGSKTFRIQRASGNTNIFSRTRCSNGAAFPLHDEKIFLPHPGQCMNQGTFSYMNEGHFRHPLSVAILLCLHYKRVCFDIISTPEGWPSGCSPRRIRLWRKGDGLALHGLPRRIRRGERVRCGGKIVVGAIE